MTAAAQAAVTACAAAGGGASTGVDAVFASISATARPPSGGEGEYIEIIINSPAATYTYTVGAGGAGGSGGTYAGAAGGSGYIIVDEYY